MKRKMGYMTITWYDRVGQRGARVPGIARQGRVELEAGGLGRSAQTLSQISMGKFPETWVRAKGPPWPASSQPWRLRPPFAPGEVVGPHVGALPLGVNTSAHDPAVARPTSAPAQTPLVSLSLNATLRLHILSLRAQARARLSRSRPLHARALSTRRARGAARCRAWSRPRARRRRS